MRYYGALKVCWYLRRLQSIDTAVRSTPGRRLVPKSHSVVLAICLPHASELPRADEPLDVRSSEEEDATILCAI
jgi:hypothetical protein